MDGWQVFCRLWCYQKQSYTDTRGATITVNQPSPTPTPEPTEEPSPEPTEEPSPTPEPTPEPTKEPEHTHQPAEEWSSDESFHWHACEGCEELLDKAEHQMTWTPSSDHEGEEEGVCEICRYKTTREAESEEEPEEEVKELPFDGTFGVGLETFRYIVYGVFGAIGLGLVAMLIGAAVRGIRRRQG